MGHYCYYQAMPEQSSLFRRLKSELPFFTLYNGLLHHPAGPYDTCKLTKEELDEVLDWLARGETFGSRAAVDRVMEDLQAELMSAASTWPGLQDRAAYRKMHEEFRSTLIDELSRLGHPAAETFAGGLEGGFGPLGPPSWGRRAWDLSLVSVELVPEAAHWLCRIDPQAFGDWSCEDFRQWQKAYLDAAENGEVIVISCH